MSHIITRIVNKWDWWIYCRAQDSLRRMVIRNPGLAYLFELQIKGWNSENPISPELKQATELFHQNCVDQRKA